MSVSQQFFAATNLLRTSVSAVVPWEFTPASPIPDRVRNGKAERQAWYSNPTTSHQFYSGVEGVNPGVRVGKDNPPQRLHAIAADYDLPLPRDTVLAAVASWKIKPSYLERTLGGNWRPVWLFPKPLPVNSLEFYSFVLGKAQKWLKLDALPGLDCPALTTATRLYANGCHWTDLEHPPIPENEAQAFFVDCVREYQFKGTGDEVDIPLDLIEKQLRDRFPNFDWPTEFSIDSQGPSFFVPESQSPLSAIVKKGGIFTFSAHAIKSFYTWADLLGSEFVRDYRTNSIAEATKDTWFDGKTYWRKDSLRGVYISDSKDTLTLAMRVQCRLSAKADPKTGISPIDLALHHVNTAGRIDGAAPLVFRKGGVLDFAGRRILNTYVDRVMLPAVGTQRWGATGNFPTISALLDNLFDPPEQQTHFLAWYQHYYQGGLEHEPRQGQAVFLSGITGIGKTATNVGVVGGSVGGHVDASKYLIEGAQFNSEMFQVPLWCVDDEAASTGDERRRNNFTAMLKKSTANTSHLFHQKFQIPTQTEWMGRIFVTTNLDFVSTRIILSTDDSSEDKVNLYKCSCEKKVVLPPKHVLSKIFEAELPYFLRWLVDWVPPVGFELGNGHALQKDNRYGWTAYQNPLMLERANQTSKAAPLAEVLQSYFEFYFSSHKEIRWRGTASSLFGSICVDPTYEPVMRRYSLEQFNRYLEVLLRNKLMKVTTETDPHTRNRVWLFEDPRQ